MAFAIMWSARFVGVLCCALSPLWAQVSVPVAPPPLVVAPIPEDIPPVQPAPSGRITLMLEDGGSHTTVRAGERVRLVAADAGPGVTYRWTKNSTTIPGGTDRVLTLAFLDPLDAGIYHCEARAADGRLVNAQDLELGVGPATRVTNFSLRGTVAPGAPFIAGFAVGGSISGKRVLIRAVGPSLARFGVTRPLARPKITVYQGATPRPGQGSSVLFGGELQSVGAFATTPGAADVVIGDYFSAGVYTIHVTSEDGSSGEVLLEVYEAP